MNTVPFALPCYPLKPFKTPKKKKKRGKKKERTKERKKEGSKKRPISRKACSPMVKVVSVNKPRQHLKGKTEYL
jgi:hypothetical protein